MRQIGSLTDASAAERFVDYLTTLDVAAQSEEDNGTWLIWIKDENHVDTARAELASFQENPDAPEYQEARYHAEEKRQQAVQKRIEARKNLHQVRDGWSAPLSRRAPTVFGLIVLCVVLAFLGGGSVFGSGGPTTLNRMLMFVDPVGYQVSGGDGFVSIKSGQLWRVVTPAVLHGGVAHLVFNMYWMYVLGGQIEPKIGRPRFLGLTLAGAALPNLLQAILVGPNFLGISGVVFAYFGYMFVRRSDGYQLSQLTIYLIFGLFILDFTPMAFHKNVAVWAHAGGLVTGAVIGYLKDLRR